MKIARFVAILSIALILTLTSCSKSDPEQGPVIDDSLAGLSPELQEQLEAIGYLQESEVEVAQETIPIYDKDRAQPGYNLYVSGHSPEAILTDMDANVVHTWRRPFEDIWPGEDLPFYAKPYAKNSFRQFHLLDNGEIIVIFELFGLAKLDKDSNVIWQSRLSAHHDVDNDEEGRIYSLGKRLETEDGKEESAIWWTYPTINILDADGQLLKTLDVVTLFKNSHFSDLLNWMQRYGDLFHNNTIHYLDGTHAEDMPAFRKGNLLISCPNMNAIFVVDPEAETVVWLLRDMFRFQHDPVVLDNGNILIFDNGSPDGPSRALEFNPKTQEVVWEYDGDEPFYSSCCSTAQRLPNGNTLITITELAMAVEVTPEGEVVWQFNNPASVHHDKLAANLYELRRITPDMDLSWLDTGN